MTDADLVVAQGTFDLLHPGHVHYLRESKALGERLVVIVSRRANVTHKESPILPATQRREIVAALDVVDRARLGHEEDIFVPIEELRPDIITLGHDQHHDEAAIDAELERRGIECRLERIGPYEPDDGLYASRDIIDAVVDRYC